MFAKQGIALRGHKEHGFSNNIGKNSDTERAMERVNVHAIINASATLDPILLEHLKAGAKNAKVI